MRESAIEREGRELLRKAGYRTEKLGVRGLPDNLVFLTPRTHCFIEWKQPNGRLTPAQKRRIPKLREGGEWVAIVTSQWDVVAVVSDAYQHLINPNYGLHSLFYAPAT